MIIREGIEVTQVTLEGYELPIPEGLSEFLLQAGFWRVDEEVESSVDEKLLSNYEKKVVLKKGVLTTRYIYKGNKKGVNDNERSIIRK
ncbi:hypothetical protein JC777_00175 (plasmid) [Bacillus cytotoxicus]|uniref:Uncharacterized protein n=1 Tax=Bacillus cytotoxicus TaxID=580165 RepID=A0AAX2CPF6_9BACI|nr:MULTISPECIES: hypothetical protein [Bacillus cereus group]MDH2882459.1 hypothetical protein [Bacillus cytotoxicus]QTR81138.1 hypothetical protein JC777_00175 [Bacillus cytotoxicus]QTR87911.1 hypothetical protein JC774_05160 [Bacillus cytotoxicus]SCM08426.1 Uncharacterized protein BCB44BAC_04599 [Bacillus cytotoxicus]HDR4573321.1 hypothetical protein [Bacillus cytotoxicus]